MRFSAQVYFDLIKLSAQQPHEISFSTTTKKDYVPVIEMQENPPEHTKRKTIWTIKPKLEQAGVR